jgi:hypothetical protein
MRLTLLASAIFCGSATLLPPLAYAQTPPAAASATPPATCTGTPDPYKNYNCLDAYLGDGVAERFYNYYRLEWGESGPPADPNAPPGRKAGWDPAPETTPPMPFTDWPYGGTTALGATRTGSADSPLMVAIANTSIGHVLADTGIQIYGWIDPGFNVSSNTTRKQGNAPIAYTAYPNTVQLDQAVIYIDRFPDTIQTDHIDWGMRLSAIYGENYRYTTSYGLASYQLLKYNSQLGYDFPMLYGELYIPQVAEGLLIRAGRYISVPDIEAQLGPNNYMYTHSLTYTFDNYTNEGVIASVAVTPNIILQFGISDGTEAAITNVGNRIVNPAPSPLYPGTSFYKDPGAHIPTYTACARINWNGGNDNLQPCANGINGGQWGYNNLQWYGFTYYHKFNDHWHVSWEAYHEHQDGVPNVNNPAVATYTTPFSSLNPATAPFGAKCATATALRCNAYAMGTVAYINYSPDPLNNFSLRPEIYYDAQGQRTGSAATYWEVSLGWQHWLSPQVELRPEIGYYQSNGAKAFNVGTKNYTLIGASDVIMHF